MVKRYRIMEVFEVTKTYHGIEDNVLRKYSSRKTISYHNTKESAIKAYKKYLHELNESYQDASAMFAGCEDCKVSNNAMNVYIVDNKTGDMFMLDDNYTIALVGNIKDLYKMYPKDWEM